MPWKRVYYIRPDMDRPFEFGVKEGKIYIHVEGVIKRTYDYLGGSLRLLEDGEVIFSNHGFSGVLLKGKAYSFEQEVPEKKVEEEKKLVPGKAIIKGKILDKITHMPVVGASVEWLGLRSVSLFDGSFELRDVPLGSGVIHVEKDGYKPEDYPIDIHEEKTYEVIIYLEPVEKPEVALPEKIPPEIPRWVVDIWITSEMPVSKRAAKTLDELWQKVKEYEKWIPKMYPEKLKDIIRRIIAAGFAGNEKIFWSAYTDMWKKFVEYAASALIFILTAGKFGLAKAILSMLGTAGFAYFIYEEGLQQVDFAIMTAEKEGRWDLVDKLIQYKKDLLKEARDVLDAIFTAPIFIIRALWEFFKASEKKMETDIKILESKRFPEVEYYPGDLKAAIEASKAGEDIKPYVPRFIVKLPEPLETNLRTIRETLDSLYWTIKDRIDLGNAVMAKEALLDYESWLSKLDGFIKRHKEDLINAFKYDEIKAYYDTKRVALDTFNSR